MWGTILSLLFIFGGVYFFIYNPAKIGNKKDAEKRRNLYLFQMQYQKSSRRVMRAKDFFDLQCYFDAEIKKINEYKSKVNHLYFIKKRAELWALFYNKCSELKPIKSFSNH